MSIVSSTNKKRFLYSSVKMANLCKHFNAVLGILIFLDLFGCVLGEISAEDVYDLLSRSIFEIKTDVDSIKRRIENVEEKVQGISTTMSPQLAGIEIKDEEIMDFKEEMNMQAFAIQKTLTAEKLLLRETVETFESKFAEFKSQIQHEIALINASLEGKSEVMFDIVNNSSSKLENGIVELKSDLNHTTHNISQFLETMEITMLSNFEDMGKQMVANITMQQSTTQSSLSSLQTSLSSLSSSVSSISYKQTYTIQPELKSLSSQISSVSSSLSSRISSVSTSLISTSSSLSSSISSLLNRIYEEEKKKVAFSARIYNQPDSIYLPKEKIIFDNVRYNEGSGYSSSSGIFTAPKTGTYIFTVNIESTGAGHGHVTIMVNGYYKCEALAEIGYRNTGGCTAVAYVNSGQQVWVQAADIDIPQFYVYKYRSQFNGFLID